MCSMKTWDGKQCQWQPRLIKFGDFEFDFRRRAQRGDPR
jgi:hypothetical protein